MVGRAALDNPDLPVYFVSESLLALSEPRNGLTPFVLRNISKSWWRFNFFQTRSLNRAYKRLEDNIGADLNVVVEEILQKSKLSKKDDFGKFIRIQIP